MPTAYQLTILIPTRNRLPFLKRLLCYYQQHGRAFKYIIGDSSDPEWFPQTTSFVESLSGVLAIEYHMYSASLPVSNKFLDMLQRSQTPYTIFCADDDFIVPKALEEGIQFLERFTDYITVNGTALTVAVQSNASHGTIETTSEYRQRNLENSEAAARLQNHLEDYTTTYYSLYRTEHLRANFGRVVSLDMDLEFRELTLSSLGVVQGKVKKLERLFLIRQADTPKEFKPIENWLEQPTWFEQYAQLCDAVSLDLADRENIALSEARWIFNRAFITYLRRYFPIFLRLANYETLVRPPYFLIRASFYWLRTHIHCLWPFQHKSEELLVFQSQVLLNQHSPYFGDFAVVLGFLLDEGSPYYLNFGLLFTMMLHRASPFRGRLRFWLSLFSKRNFPFHDQLRHHVPLPRIDEAPVSQDISLDIAYRQIFEAVTGTQAACLDPSEGPGL